MNELIEYLSQHPCKNCSHFEVCGMLGNKIANRRATVFFVYGKDCYEEKKERIENVGEQDA